MGKAWLGGDPESSEESGKNHASGTKARGEGGHINGVRAASEPEC